MKVVRVIWQEAVILQEIRDASVVHLDKGKVNRFSCDIYRMFFLLVTVSKILSRVLFNQLVHHLEDGYVSESPCGFRKG